MKYARPVQNCSLRHVQPSTSLQIPPCICLHLLHGHWYCFIPFLTFTVLIVIGSGIHRSTIVVHIEHLLPKWFLSTTGIPVLVYAILHSIVRAPIQAYICPRTKCESKQVFHTLHTMRRGSKWHVPNNFQRWVVLLPSNQIWHHIRRSPCVMGGTGRALHFSHDFLNIRPLL